MTMMPSDNDAKSTDSDENDLTGTGLLSDIANGSNQDSKMENESNA